MASQWYYSKGGQREGPVPSEQLKELAASGQLAPTDLVWKEGMAQWVEASKIKGLYPAPTEPNPQSPPPIPLSPQCPHPFGSLFSKGRGLRKEVFRSRIGGLMILAGLVGAVFFFFFFETSVEVPTTELLGQTIGGGRVNNLGLMAQRQNGMIFSFGVAIVGAVFEFIAKSKK